jgi:hypothetical protein
LVVDLTIHKETTVSQALEQNDHRVEAVVLLLCGEIRSKDNATVDPEKLVKMLPFFLLGLRIYSTGRFEPPRFYGNIETCVEQALSSGLTGGIFYRRIPSKDLYYFEENARSKIQSTYNHMFEKSVLAAAPQALYLAFAAFVNEVPWNETAKAMETSLGQI